MRIFLNDEYYSEDIYSKIAQAIESDSFNYDPTVLYPCEITQMIYLL